MHTATLSLANDDSAAVDETSWERGLLNVEEVAYVGEELATLLGVVAFSNDTEAKHHIQLAVSTDATEATSILASPPQRQSATTDPTPAAPLHQAATPYLLPPPAMAPTEQMLAEQTLACVEYAGLPWVEATTPAEHGYNPKPRKGKPIPKG